MPGAGQEESRRVHAGMKLPWGASDYWNCITYSKGPATELMIFPSHLDQCIIVLNFLFAENRF